MPEINEKMRKLTEKTARRIRAKTTAVQNILKAVNRASNSPSNSSGK